MMVTLAAAGLGIQARTLNHLLHRVECTPALDKPFSHVYWENLFPRDIYQEMLESLPCPELYSHTAERHHAQGEAGYVRSMFPLVPVKFALLSPEQRELWAGVAAALTAPALRKAVFRALSKDLAYRYGVARASADQLEGHARPTLYRETEGFEIPPHPDTRKKVVTMHLYLPVDRSQLQLGTALFRRKWLGPPWGDWRRRFEKVKQFAFAPNSGYAFVVNNSLTKKSWHGRERLPEGCGVRNTLLNTFYESDSGLFSGYLKG